MSIAKDYVTVHLQLIEIDVLEVGTVGSNKTEDLNTRVFNMITAINEQKTLKKHRSHRSQCKFDGSKCNSDQTNNEICRCECKNPKEHHMYEKDYAWNPST